MTLLNNSFTIELSLKEDIYFKEPNLSAWVSWTYFGNKKFSRYYQECTQILAWHLSFGVDRLALVQEQQYSEGTLIIIMNICLYYKLYCNYIYNIIAMDKRIKWLRIKVEFTVQWWRWEWYSYYFYDLFLFLQVFHLSAFWFASIGIIGVFFNIVAICVILLTEKVSFQSLFIFTRFSFCSYGQNSTC